MEKKLKELFCSYASKPDNMKQKEFENIMSDKKICDKKEAGKIYNRYCILNNLSFDSFKYALKEIAIKKKTNYEKLVKIILGFSEEDELKELEEKKKEIIKRQENLKKDKNKKSEEKVKEVVEDMCVLGEIMKKEIINEKKNHPEKFINIEEAIKNKEKDKSNFCLAVMAKNLEDIGITTAVEREIKNDEESVKASETVLQFIMNGMIDKKKFGLHFDFGDKKNNELLNNISEQEKFHKNLKKNLSKEYNIPEEEIIIANPQKGSYMIQVIFMSDEFNNLNENEFIKRYNKYEKLPNLKEVHSTLLMDGCKLNKSMLDPKGNRISGWGKGEYSGGFLYEPPEGWMGFGLNVIGKYDNGNDDWLAHDGNKNEWAIAYHGVHGVRANPLEQAVGNIYKGGFKVGKNQYYEESINRFKPGTLVGRGIYCSPSPRVLKQYAGDSISETQIKGKNYIMGFMMRVKPDKIRSPKEKEEYWVLNPTTDEIRPYRILVKEI